MKHIAKSLVIVGAMAAAGSAFADFGDINPYVGADYQQAFMGAHRPFNHAKKSFPGANLYVGTKFHENFGVELGYNWSKNQSKKFTLGAGELVGVVNNANARVADGSTVSGSIKQKRSGAFFDLVGFLPAGDCFELLGSLGLGWVKTGIAGKDVTTTNAANTQIVAAFSNLSAKTKMVYRLGLGGSYMVTDMVGLRVKVGYEGTTRLRLKDKDSSLSTLGISTKKFTDSVTATAGLFVKF